MYFKLSKWSNKTYLPDANSLLAKKTRFYNSGWQVSGQKFNDSSSGEFYQ